MDHVSRSGMVTSAPCGLSVHLHRRLEMMLAVSPASPKESDGADPLIGKSRTPASKLRIDVVER